VGGTVSLWTSGAGPSRAGLTVTSYMLGAGEQTRILALLDPDADLTETLLDTGTGVVQLLSWEHRDLAEMFAGTAPAPGGMFSHASFEQLAWGPRLVTATTWAGVRVESDLEVGWSRLVTTVVEELEVGTDAEEPLRHRRGRYAR
jgi:flavin reductase (DIM6/NTAB) family NADH-FMN oxidoreductase RutF